MPKPDFFLSFQTLILRSKDADALNAADPTSFSVILPLVGTGWSICRKKTEVVVRPYMNRAMNVFDALWMVCFVAIYIINAYIILAHQSTISSWHDGSNAYVDPSPVILLAVIRKHLFGLLMFFMWLKVLDHVQFQKNFAIAVYVIGAMAKQVMPFLVSFVIFLCAFAMFDYITFGLSIESVNTMGASLLASYKAALGDIDFDSPQEVSPVFGILFTVLASFLLTTLILNLLIAVMSKAYDNVSTVAEANWCYTQFSQILEHERSQMNGGRGKVSPGSSGGVQRKVTYRKFSSVHHQGETRAEAQVSFKE